MALGDSSASTAAGRSHSDRSTVMDVDQLLVALPAGQPAQAAAPTPDGRQGRIELDTLSSSTAALLSSSQTDSAAPLLPGGPALYAPPDHSALAGARPADGRSSADTIHVNSVTKQIAFAGNHSRPQKNAVAHSPAPSSALTVIDLTTSSASLPEKPADSSLVDNSALQKPAPLLPTLGEKSQLPSPAAAAAAGPAALAQSHVPEQEQLSLWQLFVLFLGIGCQAFGGPVAQIQMMKEQLVVQRKWVSLTRFHRVLAVYQVLPGPEATELACYFGYLQKGRLGSFVGGMGFLLPGFALVLGLSAIYAKYGLDQPEIKGSFKGMQVVAAAMILNACYRLGDHAFRDERRNHAFSLLLGFYGLLAFILTAAQVHFVLTLVYCGLAHALLMQPRRVWLWRVLALLTLVVGLVAYALIVWRIGVTSAITLSNQGLARNGRLGGLLALGLLGGLLTFGGAYTVIPFIYEDAVKNSEVLTAGQFLDIIAYTNILPTPLVTFCTGVGYLAAEVPGALLITLGMFTPAFSFTIIGHNFFEKALDWPAVHPFLDGVAAAVVGIVLVTAFDFARQVLVTGVDAMLYVVAIMVLQQIRHRYTGIVVVIASAAAGRILYPQE